MELMKSIKRARVGVVSFLAMTAVAPETRSEVNVQGSADCAFTKHISLPGVPTDKLGSQLFSGAILMARLSTSQIRPRQKLRPEIPTRCGLYLISSGVHPSRWR